MINRGLYHPEFHDSTSIKRTLPVIVPSMSYGGLNIADGGTASVMFARMARGDTNQDDVEQIRNDLLDYCKQDTLAIMRLHEELLGLVRKLGANSAEHW